MGAFSDIERPGGVGLLVDEPRVGRRHRGGGAGPPRDGDGDDGDDGDDSWRDGSGEGRGAEHAEFGLRLALVGITSLFLIFLAAYVNLRRSAPVWPPVGAPGAPMGLWVSTLLLAASSLTMSRAHAAATLEEARAGLARWLGVTFVCGGLFLLAQLAIWARLVSAGLLPSTNGYGAIFYALTGLHGVHVLVGLIYMGALLMRARVSARRAVRPGQVRLCALYWHFMALVWLVIFCLLWVPSGAGS